MTTLERELQKALDLGDLQRISQIMPKLFPDFDPEYAETLIAYNQQYDINSSRLVRLRLNFPNMKFIGLLTHEPSLIRGLCDIDEEDLVKLNPPCD
ncbi:hypothetical protein [Desulfosporosinus sp. FKA]|uniref:hypothetical protein n=1 Tax=Desulfosporosinus sp. FKA TaxID=1969834 RepID=UPI000B4A479C|nr:hypothetical protein [Desulfosporosinus sp. FKA]